MSLKFEIREKSNTSSKPMENQTHLTTFMYYILNQELIDIQFERGVYSRCRNVVYVMHIIIE